MDYLFLTFVLYIFFVDSYIIITEILSSTMLMQNACIIDYTPHKTRYQNFAYLIWSIVFTNSCLLQNVSCHLQFQNIQKQYISVEKQHVKKITEIKKES